jgi:2'-5' RNA ligase
VRLFVALEPPVRVLADLPRRTGREHVTLAFLGEVADPAPLLQALPAVQLVPAPRVRLAGAGRFPGGAVWLGVHGDLAPVHEAVRVALGLPAPPAPWRPHLTVGRGAVPAWAAAYEGPESVWPSVALVRSSRSGAGVVHEALGRWQLAGPGQLAEPGQPGQQLGHDEDEVVHGDGGQLREGP